MSTKLLKKRCSTINQITRLTYCYLIPNTFPNPGKWTAVTQYPYNNAINHYLNFLPVFLSSHIIVAFSTAACISTTIEANNYFQRDYQSFSIILIKNQKHATRIYATHGVNGIAGYIFSNLYQLRGYITYTT